VRLLAQPVRLGLRFAADALGLLRRSLRRRLGFLGSLVQYVFGRTGSLGELCGHLLGGRRPRGLPGLRDQSLRLRPGIGEHLLRLGLDGLGILGGVRDQPGDRRLRGTRPLLVERLGLGQLLGSRFLRLGQQLLGLGAGLAQGGLRFL
jgi:hypothetical protein